MVKLVEECSGIGELSRTGEAARRVRYHFSRYQTTLGTSGLPVPGLHRVEGVVDFAPAPVPSDLVGASLTLQLEDGRAFGVVMTDGEGRIRNEQRHAQGCSCC